MADEKKYLDSSGLIRLVANVIAKLNGKSDSSHNHDDKYSKTNHNHDDRYYTEDEVDEKISGITSGTIIVKEAEHATSADSATSATTATTATNASHATTADSATSADSATTADSATKDGSGNVIASTYETKSDADATEAALTELINGKADSSHTHAISEVTNLQSTLDGKAPTSRTVNGKALTSNITLSASDVSAYSKTEIDSKVSTLNTAIDGKEALGAVSTHNTNTSAHNDIRLLIEDLTTRLNTLADSDDTTLDQMSEIVTYIKANKSLIDSITTSKVNISDIIDNLTTNVTDKPLSAAQGVAIKSLIDTLQSEVDSKADEGHTHNYAGSDTAGGVANSAAKLETARNINLTGDVAGSVSFDGSGDASIATTVSSMHGIAATSDDGIAYIASVDGITALTAGVSFIMIPHTNSTTTTPTLNVNSLGAKGIRMRGSSATGTAMAASIAAWLAANRPVQLTYNGIYWLAEVTRPAATDLSGIVPITSGGTGANTADGAVTNFGGLSVVVSSTEPTNANAVIWIQTS